jgi:hypothetical protein
LAVDDDPAVLATVARDERGFILAGPDVRARSIKPVASMVGEGSMAVSLIHSTCGGMRRTPCTIYSECGGNSGHCCRDQV